jgi:acetyl esterase/lipase
MINMMILLMTFTACGGIMQATEQEKTGESILLWTNNIPGAQGSDQKDTPALMVYVPAVEKATGAAVVICPGGGYDHHAMDHEGRQVAEWFCQQGIAAFILRYRLPGDGYRHPIPLMDTQRAIRLVRFNAEKWHSKSDKIGIIGFSAGGHLASTAGTHFDKPVSTEGYTPDAIDAVSARPDFMILIYPVISMQEEMTHDGSKKNLLGPHPPQELVELLSNEKQVTPRTPPTFLVHASDDDGVPVENSIRFYEALRKARVPAEMHIYLKGGHGFGMRPSAGPAAQWPDECLKWMQQLGLLGAGKAQ